MSNEETDNFEANFQKLKDIATCLEGNIEMSLDEIERAFDDGMAAVEVCNKRLSQLENKIKSGATVKKNDS